VRVLTPIPGPTPLSCRTCEQLRFLRSGSSVPCASRKARRHPADNNTGKRPEKNTRTPCALCGKLAETESENHPEKRPENFPRTGLYVAWKLRRHQAESDPADGPRRIEGRPARFRELGDDAHSGAAPANGQRATRGSTRLSPGRRRSTKPKRTPPSSRTAGKRSRR
jgi:hypothetical protein